MPNSVQFRLTEAIPLEDVMCVHYTHFTSCDIVVLYENADIHNGNMRRNRLSFMSVHFIGTLIGRIFPMILGFDFPYFDGF